MLLYEASTESLYGPILAPSAIEDEEVTSQMAGTSRRTKVSHFVRARLLSTFHFLSIHSNQNQNDACTLFNRCFEKIASLTINHQEEETAWVKPFYDELTDQHNAEKGYLVKVFYPVSQQLTEHKSYINSIILKTQFQINLQDFVTQMPINIQFSHFQTELNSPRHSQLPMNILRHTLNSRDLLRKTKLIHDLSQFYILLHQTYTKLIERDGFLETTLQQLYEQGEKHNKNIHQTLLFSENKSRLSIITAGIEAVNAYHQFAGGLIRPGACDETQYFDPITIDAPISYLVTTENYDEGNIVMRILRYVPLLNIVLE